MRPLLSAFFAVAFATLLALSSAEATETTSVNGDGFCYVCNLVVEYAYKYIESNQTETKIEDALKNVCQVVPAGYQQDCNVMIDAYLPTIIDLLEKKEPANAICAAIKVCPSKVAEARMTTPLRGGEYCSICQFVAQYVYQFLEANSTEADIEAALDKVCDVLPSAYKTECTDLVNTYTPQLVDLLEQEVPADELCQRIGLCSSKKTVEAVSMEKANGLECDLCKLVVNELYTLLGSNRSEAAIESALDKVCNVLPSSISGLCTSLVSQYTDELIQLIEQDVPSDEVCAKIGLCSSKKVTVTEKSNGLECSLCQLVVNELYTLLGSDRSEAAIESALDKVCGVLPKSLSGVCTSLVSEYTPQLIQLLQQDLPADQVCDKIGLCSSKKVAAVRGGEYCSICQFVAQYVYQFLEANSTEADIEAALDKVCDVLPSAYKTECTDLVNTYTPQLVDLLEQEVPADELCQRIGLCSSKKTVEAVSMEKANGLECDLCKLVVNELYTLLGSNRSEAAIESALDKVCNVLPSSISGLCTSLVSQYTDELIQLIEQDVPSDEVCAKIGLCSSKKVAAVRGGEYCSICQFVAQYVYQFLETNSTEADIEAALDKVCDVLPSAYKTECTDLVNTYTPQLVDLLEQEVPADELCQRIGLCSSKKTVETVSVKKGNGLECSLCQLVVSELYTLLGSDRSEAAIESALDKVCGVLPKSLSGVCTSLVSEYTPQLIQLLQQDLPADQVCDKIGLCSSKKVAAVRGGEYCSICQFVAQYVYQFLEANSTEADIEAALDKVCDVLPSAYKTECTDLVNTYTPQLVDLLEQEVPADELCQRIGLCSSKKTVETVSMEKANGLECDLCKLVVNELYTLLGSNRSEAAIESALDKVCNVLPSSVSGLCTSLVSQYTDELIQLIEQDVPSDEICAKIGLCSSSKVDASSNGLECTLCEFVFNKVYDIIGDDKTVTNIENALEKVCSLVPKAYQSLCDSAVLNYTPELIALLQQDVPSSEICSKLTLCKSSVTEAVTGGSTCELCQLVANYLYQYVESNHTEEEIEGELRKVCGLLPDSFSEECDALVSQYLPQLLAFLAQDVPASDLCNYIHLCQTSSLSSSGECDLCDMVVQYAYSYLTSNKTEEKVLDDLEKVCSLFKSGLQAECKMMLSAFGPKILAHLAEEVPPSEICQKLGVCSSSQTKLREVMTLKDDCKLCQLVVGYAYDFVDSETVEDDLEKLLTDVCNILPKSYQVECTALVNGYVPQLLQMLQQAMPPSEICQKLGLCSSMKVSSSGELCDVCQFAANYVYQYLAQNKTQDEIEAAMDKVCALLPEAYSGMCKTLVDGYLPKMINLLEYEYSPADVCAMLGVCNKQTESKPSTPKANGLECSLCQLVVNELYTLLGSDRSEAAIESALDKVCGVLPKSLSGVCTSLVSEYTPQLIQLLQQDLPADQVCDKIGLCSSKKVAAVRGGEYCSICQFVAQYVYQFLEANSTEADIEAALDKVCDVLPSAYKTECTDLVNTYTPQLVDLLEQEVPADELCQRIGLCSSKKTVEVVAMEKANGLECDLCKLVVNELYTLLGSNRSEAAIESALDKVCNVLPSSVSGLCTSLVSQYTDQLIQLIEQDVPSDEICAKIGLCSSKKVAAVRGGEYCSICQFVAQYVYQFLEANSTEADIEAALDKVCDVLPSAYKTECTDLVNTYTPQLVDLLEQEVPADELCQRIGLCSSKKTVEPVSVKKGNGLECSLCQLVVNELYTLLGSDRSEAAIESALDKVCGVLPKSLSGVCTSLVSEYTPQLIQLLQQDLPADQVCDKIGLCSSKKVAAVRGGEYCSICQFVAQYVYQFLEANSTEADIEAALDKVCDVLPSAYKTECTDLVNTYTPQLVDLLEQEVPADELCQRIGLCSSKKTVEAVSMEKANGLECDLCKLVVNELYTLLGSNRSEAAIESALDKVCNVLPSSVSGLCTSLVSQYTDQLIQLIEQDVPSDEICAKIGLCASLSKKTVLKGEGECKLCEAVVDFVYNYVDSNKTEQELEKDVEKLCSLLPGAYGSECKDIVEVYLPDILQMVEAKIPADAVCAKVGVCSSSKRATSGPRLRGNFS